MTNTKGTDSPARDTLPIAPAGNSLIDAFPADAFRITKLVKRVGTGKVEFRSDAASGIVLSLDGDVICAIYVAPGKRLEGKEAINKIVLLEDEPTATLSVSTLDDVVVRVLPFMWSNDPQHTMKLSWIGEFAEVLSDIGGDGQVAVHLTTPERNATAIFSNGECQLAFTDDSPEPVEMALLNDLAAPKKGVLRVWILPPTHVSRPIAVEPAGPATRPDRSAQRRTQPLAASAAHAIPAAPATPALPAFPALPATTAAPAPISHALAGSSDGAPVSEHMGTLVAIALQYIKVRPDVVITMLQDCAGNDETIDDAINRLHDLPLRGATPTHKAQLARAWRSAAAGQ